MRCPYLRGAGISSIRPPVRRLESGDVDLTTAPQDLTKAAEIANDGSGFGISILQGDTYKFFPFDDHGNQLASQLISATKRDMGLSVVVRGKIVDGILDVSSIVESESLIPVTKLKEFDLGCSPRGGVRGFVASQNFWILIAYHQTPTDFGH